MPESNFEFLDVGGTLTFRQQHPEIPWREMAGMRNIIVHEYDQLYLGIIWDVVHNKLSELLIGTDPFLEE